MLAPTTSRFEQGMVPPARRQLGQQFRRQQARRHVFGSISYLAETPITDGLISVDRLVFVLLQKEDERASRLRLRGFCGGRVPWGVMWGGADHCRFDQRLFLDSSTGTAERSPALSDARLLGLAMRLDRELQQTDCEQRRKHQGLRLPRLWAAFDADAAGSLTGDGPEFQNGLRRTGASAKQTLNRSQRRHGGLILFPLPWVSHHWRQFATVFADVSHFPRYQIFWGGGPSSVLQGYYGAAQFDFSPESVRDASRHVDERRDKRSGSACHASVG